MLHGRRVTSGRCHDVRLFEFKIETKKFRECVIFVEERVTRKTAKNGCSRKISPRFYYSLMKWRHAAAQVIWLITLATTNGIKYFSTNSLLWELIPAFYDKLFRFAEAMNFIFYKTVSHIYDRTIEIKCRNKCLCSVSKWMHVTVVTWLCFHQTDICIVVSIANFKQWEN